MCQAKQSNLRTVEAMRKSRGSFLLILVIVVAILGFLNFESIRASIRPDQGGARLDNAAGLTMAQSTLGATLREAQALKSLSGGTITLSEAQSLAKDPKMTLANPMPDTYVYTYTYSTTTSEGSCTLSLQSEQITC